LFYIYLCSVLDLKVFEFKKIKNINVKIPFYTWGSSCWESRWR